MGGAVSLRREHSFTRRPRLLSTGTATWPGRAGTRINMVCW